jgi:tetratricopeptide (TPR) repeat protein
MFWLYRVRRIVAQSLRRALTHMKQMARTAASKPVLVVTTILVTSAVGATLIAIVLRTINPVPLMIVGPFEIPQPKEPVTFTGKTLSNMLVDSLQDIIQNGNHFRGLKSISSSKQYSAVPDCPEIPIQTSFGLEIKGISVDQLRNAWNYLRYHQQLVGGDLVRTPDGGAIIIVRLTSTGAARHWETKVPPPLDYSTLHNAMAYLASELLSDMNPEITGRYFLGQHQFESAQKVILRWAQEQPTRPEPYYYLALTFEGLTPPDRTNAERMARKAWQLDPKYHLAIGLIANCEAYRNDWQASIADNLLAHRLASKAPNYLSNLAADFEIKGDNEGDLAARQADYDQAVKFANQALHADPDMVVAYYTLGSTLDSKGDKEGAITALHEALRRRTDYLVPLERLTNLLIAQGRFDEAIETASISSNLNPNNWRPLYARGRALVAHGQIDEGIAQFRKALGGDFTGDPDRSQTDAGAIRLDLMQALLKEAKSAADKGQLDKAAEYYQTAMREGGGEAPSNGSVSAELLEVRSRISRPRPLAK